MTATTLEWFGCTTFRVRSGATTIMLDAYLDRTEAAAQPGVGVDDITEADWIVVGHAHFDHLWGAERIAARTGATIIASHESVRVMAEQGVPTAQLLPVAGGERVELAPSIAVRVFPSLHSALWSVGPHLVGFRADQELRGDQGLTVQQIAERQRSYDAARRAMPSEVIAHIAAGMQGSRGDGGALIFRFEFPDGSLLFQDTSGCWSGLLPLMRSDVAILAATARGNLDGEPYVGTLAGFVAEEAAVLQPARVLLGHHDDWLPGFTDPIDAAPVREAIAAASPHSEFVELDYAEPYAVFAGLGDDG